MGTECAHDGMGTDAMWLATSRNPPLVTCEGPSAEPVAFAAAELRRYLERILCAQLPVEPADTAAPRIHLAIRPELGLTDEGFELSGEGTTYHIVGGGPPGVVFGVYEFLRRHGGCQFSDLGPDGEFVPRQERVVAAMAPLRREPKLWYRALQQFNKEDAETARRRIDWMAKNGLNYLTYTPGNYGKEWFEGELLPSLRQRGLKLDMNHHNLRYWLPPEQYLEEHPDWYAELDGQRGKKFNQLCVCTSKQEAVDTLIANVRGYLRENPDEKLVGIIVEDGYGMCQCEQCVSQDENRQDAFREGKQEENRSLARRYAKLLNVVAQAIRGEFPDVLIGGAAYVNLLWPPHEVKLESNTAVWVALYWRDGCRPISPVHSKNALFFDALRQWQEVYPGRLTVYEYYMGMFAQCSLPYPQWEVICEDWKHLKALGVGGATIQCEAGCHSVYALNLLAFARAGWDDNVEPDKVLSEYLLGAYGSVAAELRPLFASMLQSMRQLAAGAGELSPDASNVSLFLDGPKRADMRQALQAAVRKAGDDRERRQVQRLAAAMRYWELAADFFELREQAHELRQTAPKDALALLDKLLHQAYPELREYLQGPSLSAGWLYGKERIMVEWQRKVDDIEKTAGQIRLNLAGSQRDF